MAVNTQLSQSLIHIFIFCFLSCIFFGFLSCIFHKHYIIAFSGLPGITEDESPAGITKLISLSQLWQIRLLESICLNMEKEETDFNPSISDLHNTEMGAKLRDGFLHTQKWADISFMVEGMQHTLIKLNSRYGPNNEMNNSPIPKLLSA